MDILEMDLDVDINGFAHTLPTAGENTRMPAGMLRTRAIASTSTADRVNSLVENRTTRYAVSCVKALRMTESREHVIAVQAVFVKKLETGARRVAATTFDLASVRT
jgi:hypothetical protein